MVYKFEVAVSVMDECLFCKIVAGEKPSKKILESENFIVVEDTFPKLKGHSLVISKKHYETFLDMPSEIYEELLKVCKKTASKIVEEVGADGFNLIVNNGKVAGQIIPHVHWHILPRKKDDGFEFGI